MGASVVSACEVAMDVKPVEVFWQALTDSKGLKGGFDWQAMGLDSVCPNIVDKISYRQRCAWTRQFRKGPGYTQSPLPWSTLTRHEGNVCLASVPLQGCIP